LEIIPVINKIDLPSADVDRIKEQIGDVLGLDPEEAIPVSAKAGIGIEDVLEAIVNKIPPPEGDEEKPLKALIFDSYYDPYLGAVAFVRIFDGEVKKGTKIKMMSTGKEFDVTEVGAQTPKMTSLDSLKAGDVGYIAAAIKDVRDVRIGDTITDAKNPTDEPVPGFRPAKPMVYDEVETSPALGLGFRCGFLGLLHMEIVQERLEREYNIELITTAPNVIYKVITKKGEELEVRNPSKKGESKKDLNI